MYTVFYWRLAQSARKGETEIQLRPLSMTDQQDL